MSYGVSIVYRPSANPNALFVEQLDKAWNLLVAIRYRRTALAYVDHHVDKALSDIALYIDGTPGDPEWGAVVLLLDPSKLAAGARITVKVDFLAQGPTLRTARELEDGATHGRYRLTSDVYGLIEVFPKNAAADWYLPASDPSLFDEFVEIKVTELIEVLFGSGFTVISGFAEAFVQGQRVQLPPLYVLPAASADSRSTRARVDAAPVPRQIENGSTFTLHLEPQVEGPVSDATLNVELSGGLAYASSRSERGALNPGRYARGMTVRNRTGEMVQTSGEVLQFSFGKNLPRSVEIALRGVAEGTQSINWNLLAQAGTGGEPVNSEARFDNSQTNSLGWGAARTLVAVTPASPRPAFRVSATSFNLIAPEGGTARGSAVISNPGNADLRVKVWLKSNVFAVAGASDTTVGPGRTEQIWFEFTPRGIQPATAVVQLTHNDPGAGPSEIRLNGTVKALPRGDGRIEGQVRDARSNKGLSGATVTATNLETGDRYSVPAGQDGKYRIDRLPASTYRLAVERPGFITTGFDRVPLQQLPGHRANDLLQFTRPGSGNAIASFAAFWQQVQQARAEARARRAEMWGNILGAVAAGVASGLSGTTPTPPVESPAVPSQVPGSTGPSCDVAFELTALFSNRQPLVRRFLRPPNLSPADFDANAFVQGFQGWANLLERTNTRWGETPPMPPGIPKVLWDGFMRTIYEFAEAGEREEKAGAKLIRSEARICGRLFSYCTAAGCQYFPWDFR